MGLKAAMQIGLLIPIKQCAELYLVRSPKSVQLHSFIEEVSIDLALSKILQARPGNIGVTAYTDSG